ncbi:MAG: hypothetical protein LBU51_10175 [Bacteroidales bacterium]|jgi:hypothetical protein|nr:hypothetical protein [Bacteroidales bacterium]
MKKSLILFNLLFALTSLFSQRIAFKSRIYDGINFSPIAGVNIYNYNSKQYTFTDKEGNFTILAQENDTLIITKNIYKQSIIVLTRSDIVGQFKEYYLYYKAILLREVNIYTLNPTYEGFKRDLAGLKLPSLNQEIGLTAEEKRKIAHENETANLLRYTNIYHPITYLYNKFNKKVKARQLAYEMEQYEDEVAQLPNKYNRMLVSELTGLKDKELLDFMVYCRFSYYDLIRWTTEEIVRKIESKYLEYEFFRALNDE